MLSPRRQDSSLSCLPSPNPNKQGCNLLRLQERKSFEKAILQKKIPLNKTQLRTIMGRWPASPHNSHSITEAIDDIIYQVTHRCLGTYFYYTAKKDGEYTALYQLTVTPEYNLFFDSFQNRYYQLVKKGNH